MMMENGLIEVENAEELNEVRYQLDGTGRKESDAHDALLDRTGCGGSAGVTACNGYELIADIDISSFSGGEGWLPIAHDTRPHNGCQGDPFTGTFDGNGHIVSGLFINRPDKDCIGLFGYVAGTIRRLGVIAGTIIGRNSVGGLVGKGGARVSEVDAGAIIVQSFVVSDQVRGRTDVGGLMGDGQLSSDVIQSYAVTGMLNSSDSGVGGLVGLTSASSIVQSYAVTGLVGSESSEAGGLLGTGNRIFQSYAVTELVEATASAAGLLGLGTMVTGVIHSYAVSGDITARSNFNVGPFVVGASGGRVEASYWDGDTIEARIWRGHSSGAEARTTDALRSPTDFTGIYKTWGNNASIIDDIETAALNINGTRWCDKNLSDVIEAGEKVDDNRVWDLGTATDYPVLRCTPGSLATQRAWWSLVNGKPQLDRGVLNDWLDGTPPSSWMF